MKVIADDVSLAGLALFHGLVLYTGLTSSQTPPPPPPLDYNCLRKMTIKKKNHSTIPKTIVLRSYSGVTNTLRTSLIVEECGRHDQGTHHL